MKKIYLFSAAILLLALSGCLSTVHPIFTEKDLVFDPRLVGKWSYSNAPGEPSGQDVVNLKTSSDLQIEIERAQKQDFDEHPGLERLMDKTYILRYLQDGKVDAVYFGYLVKLGNNYYMDYFPASTPATKNYDAGYTSHYVKMHTCYRIRFTKNGQFELKQFSDAFLQELIENRKIRIRHETRADGSYVITAPTQELQQYLLKYGDAPEAYGSETLLHNKIN
jgi:hypothetical protein